MASVTLKDEDKASKLVPLLSPVIWCPTPRDEAVKGVLTQGLPPCFWISDCEFARVIIFSDPRCGVLVWQQTASRNNPCVTHICCQLFSHVWETHVQRESGAVRLTGREKKALIPYSEKIKWGQGVSNGLTRNKELL